MKKIIDYWMQKPTTLTLAIGLLLALVFNFWASWILNASYAESGFPVPYFEAQLSFDAEKLKGWYGFLIETNMLDNYLMTQHIDFIFIVSVLLLHFLGLVFVARLLPSGHTLRKLMIVCALLSTVAPLADALENLVSYIMLANPLDFNDSLALAYSSFAALKFCMFAFAYIVFALGLVAAIFLPLLSNQLRE